LQSADLVAEMLGEPEVAARARGDTYGKLLPVRTANLVINPIGVIRPIL
jgi:hypothetical protein